MAANFSRSSSKFLFISSWCSNCMKSLNEFPKNASLENISKFEFANPLMTTCKNKMKAMTRELNLDSATLIQFTWVLGKKHRKIFFSITTLHTNCPVAIDFFSTNEYLWKKKKKIIEEKTETYKLKEGLNWRIPEWFSPAHPSNVVSFYFHNTQFFSSELQTNNFQSALNTTRYKTTVIVQ